MKAIAYLIFHQFSILHITYLYCTKSSLPISLHVIFIDIARFTLLGAFAPLSGRRVSVMEATSNCKTSVTFTRLQELACHKSFTSDHSLCRCCSNAVSVERNSGCPGGAEQRVCVGRALQQVQPWDAKQPGIWRLRWLQGPTVSTGDLSYTVFNY